MVTSFFKRKSQGSSDRIVRPRGLQQHGAAVDSEYCDNTVKNSKYTLLTFVPLNLWEQLHRPINLYFLIVGLVQFISIVSPVSPLSMLVPLWIGFGITAAKEAYDDFLRHREDDRDNSRVYRRIVGSVEEADSYLKDAALPPEMAPLKKHLQSVLSRDIRVGDIVALRDGEEVPCDMIALLSCHARADIGSAEELFGTAFVSTENVDGEADAKPRHCVLASAVGSSLNVLTESNSETNSEFLTAGSSVNVVADAGAFLRHALLAVQFLSGASPHSPMRSFQMVCDAPSPDVSRFHGTLTFGDVPSSVHQTIVVDENSLLVGGSKVRSTAALFGIAVYTGRDTKGNLTKKGVSIKWSQFDRLTTFFCVAVFLVQFALVVACGVTAYVWTEPRKSTMWYLGYYFQLQPGGGYGIPRQMASDIINTWEYYAIVLPVRMFIMLTVLLPVSFKVMLEVSKYYISRCVEWDLGMCYDQIRGGVERCIAPVAKNSSLAEDLGQIHYVMTDKTGTLTRNEMLLRHLELFQAESPPAASLRHVYSLSRQPDARDGVVESGLDQLSRMAGVAPFANHVEGGLQLSAQRMLEALALCNSVERPAPTQGEAAPSQTPEATVAGCAHVDWESPSPDETALVYGAHLCGATLFDRNRSSAIVRYHLPASPGEGASDVPSALFTEVAYQLMGVIPFTSERGRMSVIVRVLGRADAFSETSGGAGSAFRFATRTTPLPDDDQCFVLTKGADEKVLAACVPASIPDAIHTSLREYSVQGLRTLVFGWRPISLRDAEEWVALQRDAQALSSPVDRQREVAACNAKLERDLHVVGLTAVEDSLQEGVPETISLLRGANIKVWMLTGDKIETAKEIGLSCKMLRPSDHLFDITYVPGKDSSPSAGRSHMASVIESLRRDLGRVGLECPKSPQSPGSDPQHVQSPSGIDGRADGESGACQKSRWRTFFESFRERIRFSSNSLAVFDELRRPGNIVRAYVKGRSSHLLELRMEQSPRPRSMDIDFTNGVAAESLVPQGACSREFSVRESGVRSASSEGPRLSLLINGGALHVLQREPELMEALRPVLLSAVTVICCRVAPDQKALVVKLAKDAGHVTLAIGDGGNDVAMIQEAHVGVGITGFEGRQAALAADFSVAQFRFLARLLLVHGHQAYQRSAAIVQYSFFKCTFIALIQVLYNCFTLMSGVTFWSSFALTVYNSAVTIPMTFCFAMGTPALPRRDLLTAPYLYSMSQKGRYMSGMTFVFTATRGLIQSCVIFFLGKRLLLESNILIEEGRTLDAGVAYVPFYIAVLIVQVLIIICQTHGMTWVHWICVSPLFGVGSFIVTWMVYTAMDKNVVGEKVSTFYFIISHADMWINSLLVALTTYFLFYAIHNAFVSRYFPNLLQLYRQVSVKEAADERARSKSSKYASLDSPDRPLVAPQPVGETPLSRLVALEPACSDPRQGNDFDTLLTSFVPRL